MSEGELIFCRTDDGLSRIELSAVDGTAWLAQAKMAEFFQTSPQAITQLIAAIYEDAEADEAATCKQLLQVRREGGREVSRQLAEWAEKLDAFLSFNERDVLTHAGRLRMDVAQKLAAERFAVFDTNRRGAEALAEDEADIAKLEEIEKAARKGGKNG